MNRDRLRLAVVFSLVALTALRFLLAARTELLPEEAYYWTYAQHPSLGYFDHPPMVAWIVAAGTALLGHNELGVRLVNILLSVASCGLLFSVARRWFDQRAAFWATLLFAFVPIFAGIAFVVTPDGPLIFFWLLTLFAVTSALQSSRAGWWLLAGIGFGGAILSKYYGVLLAPSLFLFLIFSPQHRAWLRRPAPWLALGLGLVLFTPVVWWNSQNHWASFAFQTSRTSTVAKAGNPFVQFGQFWLVLVAILTPLVFALLARAAAVAVRRGWRCHEDNWNFVAAFGLPLLALFAGASFKTEVRLNWTAPAFVSLVIGGAALLRDGLADPARARRWQIGVAVTGALCMTGLVFGQMILLARGPHWLHYAHAGGWRQLARQVDATRAALAQSTGQRPFVLGTDKYNFAAAMSFYTQDPQNCVNSYALGEPGLGFRFWSRPADFAGRPAVALLTNTRDQNLNRLRAHFERIEPAQIIHIFAHGRLVREVYLVNCLGYKP